MKNFASVGRGGRKGYLLGFCLPLFISLPVLFSTQSNAQGNLLIFPKRVVFEGGKKSEVITLSNTGKDTAKYSISFVQMRMHEDGSFENISQPDSGQLFADTFIRIFPRSVVLAPNESQVVKLQLTKTNELRPGEYRSHLYFRAIPDAKSLGQNGTEVASTSISVHLVPVFGVTIAAIIRVGETNTNVSLSNLSFERLNDSVPVLKMEFNRTGNNSVYGDIAVNYLPPKGKATKVGEIQGFAVYTPNQLRRCKIELKQSDGIDYTIGKLSVTYSAQPEYKSAKLAEAELQLQKDLPDAISQKQK